MDIIATIQEIKARFEKSSELLDSDKRFIDLYYERVTAKAFEKRGCNQCYQDAFIEMFIYVKTKGLRDMPNFILKRGQVLTVSNVDKDGNKTRTLYNRSNVTDEVSISHLKKYPKTIDWFESVPENWEELVSKAKAEPKAKAKTEPKVDDNSDVEQK